MFRIVTGISGSGKTTYSKRLNAHYISFDKEVFTYGAKKLHYDRLIAAVKAAAKKDVVMDGFIFHYDPDHHCYLPEIVPHPVNIKRLLNAIKPHNLEITFIYSTLDHLFECQRSTEIRRRTRNPHGLSREEEYEENRQVLTGVNHAVKCLRSSGTINEIEYIYRLGSNYQRFPDDTHFLDLMVKKDEHE